MASAGYATSNMLPHEMNTSVKSAKFHASRKYADFPQMTPNASILSNASKVKMILTTISAIKSAAIKGCFSLSTAALKRKEIIQIYHN